jgi:hypothetical protein
MRTSKMKKQMTTTLVVWTVWIWVCQEWVVWEAWEAWAAWRAWVVWKGEMMYAKLDYASLSSG